MSRNFIPAHTLAESTDSRSLGVCVGRLQIDGETIALDDAALLPSGWHEPEACLRWTRGATALPPKTRLVVIDLAGPGHCWHDRNNDVAALTG